LEIQLSIERVVKALDTDTLWERIEAIPPESKQHLGLDHFERRLQKLSMPLYVQSLLSTLVGSLEKQAANVSGNPGNDRRFRGEIFRLGAQGAKFDGKFIHHPIGT
jgi:hypothetical protein